MELNGFHPDTEPIANFFRGQVLADELHDFFLGRSESLPVPLDKETGAIFTLSGGYLVVNRTVFGRKAFRKGIVQSRPKPQKSGIKEPKMHFQPNGLTTEVTSFYCGVRQMRIKIARCQSDKKERAGTLDRRN